MSVIAGAVIALFAGALSGYVTWRVARESNESEAAAALAEWDHEERLRARDQAEKRQVLYENSLEILQDICTEVSVESNGDPAVLTSLGEAWRKKRTLLELTGSSAVVPAVHEVNRILGEALVEAGAFDADLLRQSLIPRLGDLQHARSLLLLAVREDLTSHSPGQSLV